MAGQYRPIESGAYRLFIEELERHLSFASQLLQGGSILNQSERKALGSRFHTIRGGAGFFGFDEVVSTAKELEMMLLWDEGSSTPQTKITTLVGRLVALASELPPPVHHENEEA